MRFINWRAFRIFCICVSILTAIYAVFIEPFWVEVTYHESNYAPLRMDGLHPMVYWRQVTTPPIVDHYKGYIDPTTRVVQLSDLHLHKVGSLENIVLEKIDELKPDLLLLTGDVVDTADSLSDLNAFLSRINARLIYAVLGNWEYWGNIDLDSLREIYERHNVKLLVNECVQIIVRGRILQIAGLDDFTAGKPDETKLDRTCKNGGDILMQHSPGYLYGQPSLHPQSHWRIALSGHSHGGQITFLGYPLYLPEGSGPYASGWYLLKNSTELHVSRGIGTSVLRARLGSRPEITFIEFPG